MSETQKYRKRPVVIEAVQWTGDNFAAAGAFCPRLFGPISRMEPTDPLGSCNRVRISTLEGDMYADPGDWIIRGVKGEFYPCKPDIFAATYEPAPAPIEESERVSWPAWATTNANELREVVDVLNLCIDALEGRDGADVCTELAAAVHRIDLVSDAVAGELDGAAEAS